MTEKILIVEDEETVRDTLASVLKEEGYSVSTAVDGYDAIKQIENDFFDLLLCDVVMPKIDGMDVLKTILETSPSTQVVIMTAFGTIRSAVEAIKLGAIDYVTKPFLFEEIIFILKRIFDEQGQVRINIALKEEIKKQMSYGGLISGDPSMQAVFVLIEKVARTDSTVLITGKSGTGKELVAHAIYEKGSRADKPFLPINCGAITAELIESELFGYLKGAFTGAFQNKQGYFKVASGGTLFFDEICSLPLHLQSRLLRVLEAQEITPVGSAGVEKIDVRIITATNKDLLKEVAEKRFREDLYYRLKVFEIALPALEERKMDIPLLVEHFIKQYNRKFNKSVKGVSSSIMNIFLNYEWKGNVRELENVIERAIIVCERETITENDIWLDYSNISALKNNNYILKDMVSIFEKEHIKNVLRKTDKNKNKAAELLGLSLSSLYRKMDELKIEVKP